MCGVCVWHEYMCVCSSMCVVFVYVCVHVCVYMHVYLYMCVVCVCMQIHLCVSMNNMAGLWKSGQFREVCSLLPQGRFLEWTQAVRFNGRNLSTEPSSL